MTNQIYTDASAAMKAAYELSQRLHRSVWRHTGVDGRGATVWVVSLEKDPVIALGEFLA